MAAKKPNDGPPKSRRLPSVWPSPTAMSTPHSPGVFRMASGSGSQAAMRSAPASCAASASARQVLDRAEEVRLLDDHRADVVGQLGEIGGAVVAEAPRRPPSPRRARACAGLARVGMDAAGDHEPPPVVRVLGDVAGGGDRARALVHGRVRDGQAGQLGDRRLVLEHRLQPALRYLGLVGRVRGEELGARDDRVDQRRHVVVVHAGAEEADLVLGRDVAGGQRAELVEHLLLGQPLPQAGAAGGRVARRPGCPRTAPRSSSTPIVASISMRSSSVAEV